MRLFAEQVTDQRLDTRHAGLSTHQNNFIELLRCHAGIREGLLAGSYRTLDDVLDHLLETGTRELHDQVLGASCIGSDERQVDFNFEEG